MAALAILAGAGAMWYTRNTPVAFRSTAVIQVEPEPRKQVWITDDGHPDLTSPENVQTIVENFRNRSLMLRVVRALNLTSDPAFAGGNAAMSEETAVRILQRSTGAMIRPRTRLIDVTAVHTDPMLVRKIANSLVEEFLKQLGEQRYQALEAQNAVLVQKATELRTKLDQAEEESQAFQKNEGATSLQESRQLVTAKLATLSSQLTAVRADAQRLKMEFDQANAAGKDIAASLAVSSIARDASVISARERLAAHEGAIALLAQSYREKHPKMIEAASLLPAARAGLDVAIEQAKTQLRNQSTAAASVEASLIRAVTEQEKAAFQLDEKLVRYRRLQREVESTRLLYEAVSQQLKQSTLALGVEPIAFRVVEPASPAAQPRSMRGLIVGGVAVFAFALTGALVAALFLLDSSIRTVDDAERHLQLPVLAAVPTVRRLKTESEMLTILSRPGSAAAESFRTLRTALTFGASDGETRVILVTSAVPGEGKTMTSANIAVAFAQQSLRTLLIDADLRRPSITHLFNIPTQARGLSDALLGNPVEPLAAPKVDHLSLLPAGTKVTCPAELLTGAAMSGLLRRLSGDFDRIIIDTAPVNTVSDALNFAHQAHAVCLVVRSNKTSVRVARRAIELLRRAHVRSIGVALNRLPTKHGRDYHYYYSSHERYDDERPYGGLPSGAPVAASQRAAFSGPTDNLPLPSRKVSQTL